MKVGGERRGRQRRGKGRCGEEGGARGSLFASGTPHPSAPPLLSVSLSY